MGVLSKVIDHTNILLMLVLILNFRTMLCFIRLSENLHHMGNEWDPLGLSLINLIKIEQIRKIILPQLLLLVLWHLGGRFGLGLYRSPDLSSLAPLMGWCAAAGYSLLAGFSLPTQRALIAVTVVVVARLAYRKLAPVACFFVGAVADCAESAPCRSQRRVLAVIFSRWDSCGLV